MSSKSKKASRSQKRKQQEIKRRKQKLKQAAKNNPAEISKNLERDLTTMAPRAFEDELDVDVAIFSAAALEQLESNEKQEVIAVQRSLELIEQNRFEDATAAVEGISRQSRLAQWRMLIRGMKHWFCDELDAARRSWSRLDPERRPARIARAFQLARETELGNFSAKNIDQQTGDCFEAEWAGSLANVAIDNQLLAAARLVRRTQVSRPALRIAGVELKKHGLVESEDDDLISTECIKWLCRFARDFKSTEPEFVNALEINALKRAYNDDDFEMFSLAQRTLNGRPFDRKNYLLSYQFELTFSDADEERANRSLEKYLEFELPWNQEVSDSVRNAIASKLWLKLAEVEAELMFPPRYMIFSSMERTPDPIKQYGKACSLFDKSIAAYPGDSSAYQAKTKWLADLIELKVAGDEQVKVYLTDQLQTMENWNRACPDEMEPRRFLVDHAIENRLFDVAEEHVQWFVNSRPKDPRVKALPWRLSFHRAMELSRLKSTLSQVDDALKKVEQEWPTWLSKHWLPYLHAAFSLRKNDQDEYEKRRIAIVESSGFKRDSLLDAVSMFSAAHWMGVKGAPLKTLRNPVDAAIKACRKISNKDLFEVGSFFWDLNRASMLYPGYRIQASKLGREFVERASGKERFVSANLNSTAFRGALYWASEHRFWQMKSGDLILQRLSRLPKAKITFAATAITAGARRFYTIGLLKQWAEKLRDASQAETCPFYHFWFAELADRAEQAIESLPDIRSPFESMAKAFAARGAFPNFGKDPELAEIAKAFAASMGADFDTAPFGDFDDEDDDFEDDECDCENCRRKRQQSGFMF